jgi:hypothetical protein
MLTVKVLVVSYQIIPTVNGVLCLMTGYNALFY